jgi:hypothetical protein
MSLPRAFKSLFLFLSLAPALLVNASRPPADSTRVKKDSTLVFFFNNNIDQYGKLNIHVADTGVTAFQDYNPLYRLTPFVASLGNTGSASSPVVPYPFITTSGFDYGIHTFDPYLFLNDSVRYYKVMKTYTDLKYVQGANKELFFNAIFSRNIYKSFNLGFDFRVMTSPGAYQRQKTNIINFVLTAQYFSKDKRWGVFANLRLNRIKNYENGGIKYDSLFEDNIETTRSVIPVNLSAAANRVKESGFYMKNYFNLTNKPHAPGDSSASSRRNFNLGRLIYTFSYARQIGNYMDGVADTGFYQNIYYDTLTTYDSITVQKINNELAWTNPSFKPDKKFRTLQLDFRFRHQYITITDHNYRFFLNQITPSAWLGFQPYKGMRLEIKADYIMGDYNGGDYHMKADLSQILGSSNKNGGIITLSGIYALQEPVWYLHQFAGNNFLWDTSLVKIGVIGGTFAWNWKYLQAGANISRINHFVYLDQQAEPKQLDKEFGYIYTYLNTDIDLWKFKFKGEFAYQTVQGTNVLRVPAFVGNLAVYFTQPLFKGAAVIQPGLNFYYNTPYNANAYMPATRSFYLQDNQQIGNYVYMDMFINMKIQRARFFLAYTHFNASFMAKDYYTVPNYPMQDAAFKFGVTWRFYD